MMLNNEKIKKKYYDAWHLASLLPYVDTYKKEEFKFIKKKK